MISVLRKTPPIAAENTIPDDGSAPDLCQICANPSLYDYAPFLSFTQQEIKNRQVPNQPCRFPFSFFLFCTAPTEAKLSLLPGYDFYLLHAASDAIPLDLISFQLQEKAAAVAAVYSRFLRFVSIVDHTVFSVFHICMHFYVEVFTVPAMQNVLTVGTPQNTAVQNTAVFEAVGQTTDVNAAPFPNSLTAICTSRSRCTRISVSA